ncbi:MAG: NAD-dependent epimerase/dehydratase family protein [Clostridia bacterium]|nr:NAD-dependent epimerase/dehydratase family protein [Clostridia bacterium]
MILITGATGHTGQFLLEEIQKSGKNYKIRCLVRKDSPYLDQVKKYQTEISYGDMEDDEALRKACQGIETIVHIVNIRYSPKVMQIAAEMGVKKVILIHTTGMYSKFRAYAEEYIKIEKEIIANCKVDYVILRPTMIYGSIRDHNMHKLIHYIKKHKFFPVFGSGKGLMQPVHARDLAKAIFLVLENNMAVNRCYNIPGANPLPYRDILKLIAVRVNPGIKFLYIPYRISLMMGIIYNFMFTLIGKKGQISIEQIRRLSEDKCYSYEEADRDFGYSPITFEEGIEEEIRSMGY